MSTETKEKRKRAPRRNYERELANLKMYCEANVKSLGSIRDRLNAQNIPVGELDGEVAAYTDILSRLNGAK